MCHALVSSDSTRSQTHGKLNVFVSANKHDEKRVYTQRLMPSLVETNMRTRSHAATNAHTHGDVHTRALYTLQLSSTVELFVKKRTERAETG